MRKTLQDVASYLKEIMVPKTYEAYEINPVYTNVSDEDSIREGVLAFKSFLSRLYDFLYTKGDVYDNSKKVAHEYENRAIWIKDLPERHTNTPKPSKRFLQFCGN